MRRRALAVPRVEIVVESARWEEKRGAKAVIERAVATALDACKASGGLTIVLTDDAAIRELNRAWRGLDQPTNVLSFPLPSLPDTCRMRLRSTRSGGSHVRAARRASARSAEADRIAPVLLGDIVISYETTAREARAEAKPFPHHLSHLAIHGLLHLLGYDHATDDEADTMERLERAILARLNVPDPYAPRAAAS